MLYSQIFRASYRFLIIIIGYSIGVFALRFLADLFQVWMEKFVHLEMSGYLAIALVATKLLAEIINPALVVPELLEIMMILVIFAFGFSKQHQIEQSAIF